MQTLLSLLLTILVPFVAGGDLILQSKPSDSGFFGKEYTDVIKGLCCLIVIYVHVAPERGNVVQDAIGSFAYVCVTFFFLVSAYGMLAGVERKKDYLKTFLRNRLVSLLIPCVLVNIVGFGLDWYSTGAANLMLLYYVNNYVVVLLEWCVWFYIVEWCRIKWFAEKKELSDLLLSGGVILSSLYLYFYGRDEVGLISGWCFERLGLVWGILLYRYFDSIVVWMEKKRTVKVFTLTFLSLILGVAYLKYKTVYFWGEYLLKVVLGVFLLMLLFTSTSNRKWGGRVSKWLGSISYEVYLSHAIILVFISSLLPAGFNSGAYILISIIITLFISTAIHAIAKPIVMALRK